MNNVYTLEFQESQALAEKVLDLAKTHMTPPMPKVYEVLYTYAGGENNLVNKHIDMIIDANGGLNIYDVNQVYNEYFCINEKNRRQNDKQGQQLKSELDVIIELIKVHALSNKEYAGSLNNALKNLEDNVTQQQLRAMIETLLADNHRMQLETNKLTGSLEKSRIQMQEINEELAEARKAAMLDPVTKLGNRRWLESNLDTILSEAKKSGSTFCTVFVDIDHFKRVNDKFGHAAGDQVLRFFGSLLIKNIHGKSLCARYGGEEFIIIFPNTDMAEAKQHVESIRKQLESSKLVFSVSKNPIGVITASFGIVKNRADDDVSNIIMRADEQLYKAKELGRNCVVCDE